MRLIDANGSYTLKATDNTGHSLCFGGGIISAMDDRGHCICEFDAEDAPTIEASPVVHGYWREYYRSALVSWKNGEPVWVDRAVYYCDGCSFGTIIKHNYCPRCGQKMDGGVSDG